MGHSSNTTHYRTPEHQDLVNDFINEAFASLERTEELVESLGTDDIPLIERNIRILFRTFHSIKGVVGFLQFMVIHDLTHEAETLFDTIRKYPARQEESVLQAVYELYDCMRLLVQGIQQHGSDNVHGERVQALVSVLQQLTHRRTGGTTPASPLSSADRDEPRSQKNHGPLDAQPVPQQPSANNHSAELRAFVALLNASAERLAPTEEALVHIRSLHTLLTDAAFKQYLPEESDAKQLAQSAAVFSDMMVAGDLSLDDAVVQTLQSQIHALVAAIEALLSQTTVLENEAAIAESSIIEPDIGESDNAVRRSGSGGDHVAAQPSLYAERSEIRVETVKLDHLFDLVGELVTMQTMTLNSPDIKDLKLPQFRKSAAMLAKITRQLQSVSMSMRMTPVEILFAKMKRVTREVAGRLGKHIELNISGADTEMDKNVIELMFDPLMHILRNAIDHGIESPSERERVGKPATSTIHLGAMYEGNEILIFVRDDGAGLNREKILQRALERGIAPANATHYTDEQVWKFIFEAGFSTADVVTDVSGRGVGMDVVRRNIEKLRGSVQVSSRKGKGATVTLRIPLTLASMDVMTVRVGGTHYAIPLGSVRQSFRPRMAEITTTMDGLEVVRVREVLYPIIRLHEMFQQTSDTKNIDEGILVIVEASSHKVCLFVDEVVGQQQTVVKPLSQYIGVVYGLSGCMILGDGSIGLILDVDELIRLSEEAPAALNTASSHTLNGKLSNAVADMAV